MQEDEIWKEVPGTNYLASSYGNIRHKDSTKNRKVFDNGNGYLSFVTNSNGYKINYAHRFVLLAFDYRDNHSELEANHIDFDRSNNKINNLRWDTRKDNMGHSWSNGRFTNSNEKQSRLMTLKMQNGTNPLCYLSEESKKRSHATRKLRYKKENHPFYKSFGTSASNAKLKEEDVVDIRRLHSAGMPMLRISKLINISYSAVNSIVYRKTWAHIL